MHWLGRYRLLVLALICVFWTGLIVVGHFFSDVPFLSTPWRGEQSFEDVLRKEGRKTAAPRDFVFLGLDQSTLQMPPLSAEEVAGNRAFQLMTERPFPCALARLSLERRWHRWDFRFQAAAQFRFCVLEWARSDFEGTPLRLDRTAGQPRRGCQGSLLVH